MFFVYQHHMNWRPVVIVEARTEQAALNRAWEKAGVDVVSRCDDCGDFEWTAWKFHYNKFNTLDDAKADIGRQPYEVYFIHPEGVS